ncbi:(2Fe-2S)-binding protein [Nocardioides sp. T2.26MG-1]|uniref:(2Fe-2S)-binding protein n=1 Tax=Nocardioides sp. T2.26MG-1 TaxID=3041166 RepID=UPI002477354A|nr:(2Fe-2S)-binding protein [Nocardioides sp. T2.26MG-1]CAI9412759.1 Carbon monoxide dehydrogenase small chain [Nocardioides sp. T2.26MG-1]
MQISVTVNGQVCQRDVEDHWTLLRLLRDGLGLTGSKEGCGAGECGACTVELNGRTVNSCLVLAVEADGGSVRTVEGEAEQGRLSRIQEAFARHHAVQCGFCTGGMVMSVRDLLQRNPQPTVREIQEGIEGNFCRCTGYAQIIEAVLDVSGQLDDSSVGDLRHV